MKNLFKYKNKTVEILCDDGEIIKGIFSLSYDINYSPIIEIGSSSKKLYPENVCKIKIIKKCG